MSKPHRSIRGRPAQSRANTSSTESDSFDSTASYKDEEESIPYLSGSSAPRKNILYTRGEGAGASSDDDTEEEVKRPLKLPRGEMVQVRSRGSKKASKSSSKRKTKKRSFVMRSVGNDGNSDNSSGSGATTVLIILGVIVLLAALGGLGYYLYQRHGQLAAGADSSTNITNSIPAQAAAAPLTAAAVPIVAPLPLPTLDTSNSTVPESVPTVAPLLTNSTSVSNSTLIIGGSANNTSISTGDGDPESTGKNSSTTPHHDGTHKEKGPKHNETLPLNSSLIGNLSRFHFGHGLEIPQVLPHQ